MSKLKVSAIHDPDNDNLAIGIDSSGKVGIGTTSPLYNLDINDSDTVAIIRGTTASLMIAGDSENSGASETDARLIFTGDAQTDISNLNHGFELALINDEPGSGLIFHSHTASADRMRIHSNGDVVVGTYNNPATTNFVKASASGIIQSGRTGTGNQPQAEFFNGNGVVGSIYTNGSSTSFNTSSDYRLKENVVDMDSAIDRVKTLQPKRFNWIADSDNTLVDGFLAHEVSSIIPEAITGTHNEVDSDGNPVYQGIDQSKLVPLLTGALQEAIAKIEALETRIETLENA